MAPGVATQPSAEGWSLYAAIPASRYFFHRWGTRGSVDLQLEQGLRVPAPPSPALSESIRNANRACTKWRPEELRPSPPLLARIIQDKGKGVRRFRDSGSRPGAFR